MNIEEIRDFLLSLPMAEECQPFGEDTVIYKIGGKWFAAYIFDRPGYIPVKCNPDRAVLLRDKYSAITPAWHFNKRHWNDLYFESLPENVVKEEILHSYFTVIKENVSPKKLREELLENARRCGFEDSSSVPE